jgi:hypothetical protein
MFSYDLLFFNVAICVPGVANQIQARETGDPMFASVDGTVPQGGGLSHCVQAIIVVICYKS